MAMCITMGVVAWNSMAPPNGWPDTPPLSSEAEAKGALFGRCVAHVGELLLGLLLVPVTRHGLVQAGFGISFAAAVRYHRYLGRAAVALITVHLLVWWIMWWNSGNGMWVRNAVTFNGYYECSDGHANPTIAAAEASWLIMVIMAGCAISAVRRGKFEVFYVVHQLYFLALPLAAWHSFFSGGWLPAYLFITGVM